MKNIKTLLAAAALAACATSCLNSEDPHNAGFYFQKPSYVVNSFFANNTVDTVSFVSYGNWAITLQEGASWCQVGITKGHGNALYTFPVTFQPNTTGQGRSALLHFTDTDYPGEAAANILYWQYATRGDGTLGNAADVKAISGSDGSRFEFTYDDRHRPLELRITRDNALVRHLRLAYYDRDSMLTITDGGKTLRGYYSNDYQPQRLVGDADTVCYGSQYYSNGMAVSATYAFNLEHRTYGGANTYYAFRLGGQQLQPDSLHCADSLRIATVTPQGTQVKKLMLTYEQADNRHQSADVNQLVFGAEQCDPYQLLSLFRYARHTSILSVVKDDDEGTTTVQTTLNADGSVQRMTVTPANPAASPVTYEFEY